MEVLSKLCERFCSMCSLACLALLADLHECKFDGNKFHTKCNNDMKNK